MVLYCATSTKIAGLPLFIAAQVSDGSFLKKASFSMIFARKLINRPFLPFLGRYSKATYAILMQRWQLTAEMVF